MKKLMAFVLVCVLIFAMAACAPQTTTPPADATKTGAPAAATDAPKADAPKTEPAAAEQSFVLKLAHIRPQDSVADKDIQAFAADVEAKSKGTIKFEIYPASQLGDYTTVLERVSIGDVDMQIAPIGTNLDKAFGISYCPYLVLNWEEARKVYSSGGDLVKAMGDLCNKNDIQLIGTYPLYFGGIALTKPPKDPANLSVKEEIKIRVPKMKAFELAADQLGYLSTPLPAADTFTAMQTGMVDGAIGYGAEGYYSNYRDLIKYYLPIFDHFELWYVCVSDATWKKLSPNQQEIMLSCAKAMEEKRFGEAEAQETEYEKKLEDAGVKIVRFTDAEIKNFAQTIRTNVWPQIKADFNAEFFDGIVEKYGLLK